MKQQRPRTIKALVVALLCLLSGALFADIYKWKDADGKVHVSDQPPADREAQRLRLPVDLPKATSTEQNQAPRVVMLSATWCGVCKSARTWLTQNSVPFTEYDVEKNDTGKSEYRRLAGHGVPIILVGDQRMDGFSPERIEAMLSATK